MNKTSAVKTTENYVTSRRGQLSHEHYVLLANVSDYWFNASADRLREYRRLYGDDFCLVIYRSGPQDDAYVMPFEQIASLFTERSLQSSNGSSQRWIGSMDDGYLRVRGNDEVVRVEQYHNAFHLL
jgi:hypothetical protein